MSTHWPELQHVWSQIPLPFVFCCLSVSILCKWDEDMKKQSKNRNGARYGVWTWIHSSEKTWVRSASHFRLKWNPDIVKELTCRHTAQNTDIPVQWPGFKWSDEVWKLRWDVNEWFLFVISTVSARTVWGHMWLSQVSQSSQMTVRRAELPQTTRSCCYSRFASPATFHADILHLFVVVLWLSLVVLYLFMANLHLFISLWSFCISQPEKEVKVHTIWLVVLGSIYSLFSDQVCTFIIFS